MALVNITSVTVLSNPAPFLSPLSFEVEFECLQELEEDLEWKVIYVGSAEDARYDQELESVLVGPVPVGINRFILEADAPDVSRIPPQDLKGVTVVLLTCSYREKEFVRIGYYVNNDVEGAGQQDAEAAVDGKDGGEAINQEDDAEDNEEEDEEDADDAVTDEHGDIVITANGGGSGGGGGGSAADDDDVQMEQAGGSSSGGAGAASNNGAMNGHTSTVNGGSGGGNGLSGAEGMTVEKDDLPPPDPAKLIRNILAEKPRVTRFPISWGSSTAPPAAEETSCDSNNVSIKSKLSPPEQTPQQSQNPIG